MTRRTAYGIIGWFLYLTICLCVIAYLRDAQREKAGPVATVPPAREKSDFEKQLEALAFPKEAPPPQTAQDLALDQYHQLKIAKKARD